MAFLLFPRLAAAQDQRAVLELVVNGVASGETLVIIRGDDALLPVAVLTEAGMRTVAGRRETVNGREFVALASLQPDVTFSVDEVDLKIELTVSPDLLGRQVRDLWTRAPADLQFRADSSAFLNYSVNYTTGNRVSTFAESAASLRRVLFYNTLTATNDSILRGLTSLSFDQRRQLRRWTVGDSFSYTGALGGDAWIAGLNVTKEFSIDPYFVRFPSLSLSTPINTPSVMEVRVNGQIVSQERVAPGRVDLQNLPLTLGRNDARIIVRDAFGATRELSSNFYLTTTSLAKGVHDYQYAFGVQRLSIGSESWNYRTPVGLARHRVGLSNVLTAGGRFEMRSNELMSGGPTFNIRLPFGEVEASASASRAGGRTGNASQVGFTYASRSFGAGGTIMAASREYVNLTPNLVGEDPARRINLYTSAAVGGPLSVTLQHTLTRMHQQLTRSRTGVLSNVHLARSLDLTASVSQLRDENGRSREAYAGITVLFGRASAIVSRTYDARGARTAIDSQQSLPVGTGYGYQVRAESGPSGAVTGAAQYQNQYGRYEIRQESLAGVSNTVVSAAGSLVAIGGGVYAARPVRESFALVRVPNVEGVRAFSSHQEVGRTGHSGNLLIPDLQAYYGNLLNIADTDVPLTHAVPTSNLTLAPPYRGGALALFPVHQIRRVVGRVHIVDGESARVPEYGQITVRLDGESVDSPLGSNGNFYFENLRAGRYTATVEDRTGTCSFIVEVPSTADSVVNLGALTCVVRGER
jgi:outer membrane usher protein